MKHLIIILFIMLLTIITVNAGNQWESKFDQSWKITVNDCQNDITIYNNCLIVNNGINTLTFMPNQGRIPTGNGTVIKIFRSACTEISMIAD